MLHRFATLACAALLLSSCSQRFQTQPSFLPTLPGARTTGALQISVTVPRERRAHYLSPSSKGMTVDVTGPTTFKKTVGLTVATTGCKSKLMTLQCALNVPNLKSCPSKKPCYTATVRTYDAYAKNKIPKNAHLLSAVSGIKFHVGSGTTLVPLVLDGIPALVAFVPSANSALTGKQSSGFIYPKCTSSPQTVSVVGVDARGNYIVGPGSPTISLTSGNPAQMRVGKGSAPNAFVLNEPAAPGYAFGNHAVILSAAAKPSGKGLGAGVVTHVKVTYSGDICGTITEFTIPTSGSTPYTIAAGPDGNVWIPEQGKDKIARLTPGGVFHEFPLAASSAPFGITAGPDGNMWFTEFEAIGKMTTAGKLIFEKPSPHAALEGITTGSDGNLWFVEDGGASHIDAITTAGTFLPEVATLYGFAQYIAAGPDGALWFTEILGNGKIGRITTGGALVEYSTTTSGSSPSQIVSAHGALWFAEIGANKIGRIDTAGNVTSEYPLPEASSQPYGIALGPDGAIWFTEFAGNRVGRLALDGSFLEYSIPTVNSQPQGITTGPDGAIWFVEYNGNKVGRLR